MGCGGSKSGDLSSSSEANAPTRSEGLRVPGGEEDDHGITAVEIEEETSGETSNLEEKLSPRDQPDLLVKEEIVQIEKIDEEDTAEKIGTFPTL